MLQVLITLLELSPFVLMVELSRRLLTDAGTAALVSVVVAALVLQGAGTLLSALLLLALHVMDSRFERALRERLLGKLARLPMGWFTARGSGSVKRLVQDDTLALHYLVTHAVPTPSPTPSRRRRRGRRTDRPAGLPVLGGLAHCARAARPGADLHRRDGGHDGAVAADWRFTTTP